jgi:fructosamine-3-kinase
MFEAEAEGLAELKSTGTIRVPDVIDVGVADGQSFISLERLALSRSTVETECALGQQLADLHRCTQKQFGWHRDNTIGLTPQRNDRSADWIEFFREYRLQFQLELATANGYGGEITDLGEKLCNQLDKLFDDYDPVASLLHGDLWGGNWGSVDGEPVIFDPAVYYGDRESDIAMTRLFGGFGISFYEAYEFSWPMQQGFDTRLKLYQLYHVLNHMNLFGSGYRDQATGLLRELTDVI